MAKPKIFIDEDVHDMLAEALRRHGYDAVNVREVGRKGLKDMDQLAFAVSQERAMLTFNVADYKKLAVEYFQQGLNHFGIIVSPRRRFKDLLDRTLKILELYKVEDLINQIIYL